jgi:hypothetical protein
MGTTDDVHAHGDEDTRRAAEGDVREKGPAAVSPRKQLSERLSNALLWVMLGALVGCAVAIFAAALDQTTIGLIAAIICIACVLVLATVNLRRSR